MPEIRLMIVDDSSMMRMIISNVVSRLPDVRIVATCENGSVALSKLAAARPGGLAPVPAVYCWCWG